MDLHTYNVIDPVQHDGLRYAPGALIALNTETAAQLLAVGAIGSAHHSSADAGESPEGRGAAAIAADSAPRASTAGATVTPIGAKTKPAKAAPAPAQ